MIESTYSLYKLIILYMLKKVKFPLTNAQISDFMLGREYTSYFHLQWWNPASCGQKRSATPPFTI